MTEWESNGDSLGFSVCVLADVLVCEPDVTCCAYFPFESGCVIVVRLSFLFPIVSLNLWIRRLFSLS